jgi:hypothetical protein
MGKIETEKFSRRDVIRLGASAIIAAIAVACGVKSTPEPAPTKAATPERATPTTEAPTATPTPTKEPTPTPEAVKVVKIPESIFPKYGAFTGDLIKDGKDSGGLVIADLLGKDYMAYIVFNLEHPGGPSEIRGDIFTLWETGPGTYEPRSRFEIKFGPEWRSPITELRVDGKTLKGVFLRDSEEYEFVLEAKGQGKAAVIDAIRQTQIRERNYGPNAIISDEKIIEDLKGFRIALP